MAEYIEREKAFKLIKEQKEKETGAYSKGRNKGLIIAGSIINNKEVLPAADVVEVSKATELIIRKKAQVINYWREDVKKYRAMKGYSDIEHATDNFLRGYNEAVDDMLTILDGQK